MRGSSSQGRPSDPRRRGPREVTVPFKTGREARRREAQAHVPDMVCALKEAGAPLTLSSRPRGDFQSGRSGHADAGQRAGLSALRLLDPDVNTPLRPLDRTGRCAARVLRPRRGRERDVLSAPHLDAHAAATILHSISPPCGRATLGRALRRGVCAARRHEPIGRTHSSAKAMANARLDWGLRRTSPHTLPLMTLREHTLAASFTLS